MSALRQLQRQVSAYVLHGVPLRESIIEGAAVSATQRLQVYADAYRLRLLEVLGNELPGTRLLLGEDDFERLCRDYIEARSSAHYNLRWYGGDLPGFAAAAPAWRQRRGLLDMLSLEAALTAVFDAADAALLQVSDLAKLDPADWPGIGLRAQPALRVLSLNWNVAALRLAADSTEPAPALEKMPADSRWLCWRQQERVRYRELEADEAALIDALQTGLTFGELCDGLLAHHDEDAVPLRAVQLLRRWTDDEWLAAPG